MTLQVSVAMQAFHDSLTTTCQRLSTSAIMHKPIHTEVPGPVRKAVRLLPMSEKGLMIMRNLLASYDRTDMWSCQGGSVER